MRTEGPIEPIAAARIGTQVAAALAAAHRAGIVHRDVKPGNILMGEDGTAKIADFGISHAVDDVSLTSTGLVTGTPAYLAPEVARGADSDFASDVYSLGATLYMAVEGHPPVGNTDSNPMAVLHRVASGEVLPPQRTGPLTGMLATMMSIDPSERPSMVDVANRLADVSLAPNTVDNETRALPRAAFAAPAAIAAAPAAYSAPEPAAGAPAGTLPARRDDRRAVAAAGRRLAADQIPRAVADPRGRRPCHRTRRGARHRVAGQQRRQLEHGGHGGEQRAGDDPSLALGAALDLADARPVDPRGGTEDRRRRRPSRRRSRRPSPRRSLTRRRTASRRRPTW